MPKFHSKWWFVDLPLSINDLSKFYLNLMIGRKFTRIDRLWIFHSQSIICRNFTQIDYSSTFYSNPWLAKILFKIYDLLKFHSNRWFLWNFYSLVMICRNSIQNRWFVQISRENKNRNIFHDIWFVDISLKIKNMLKFISKPMICWNLLTGHHLTYDQFLSKFH